MAVTGCGAPEAPVLADLVFPDAAVTEPDGDAVPPLSCDTPADCPVVGDCCVAPVCEAGTCRYLLVPECCQREGPCATPTEHLSGECVTPCGAFGCEARLRLEDEGCGEVASFALAELAVDGRLQTRVDWRGAAAGPVFSVDLRAPSARAPTLSLGSATCDALQPGITDVDCVPLATWSDGWAAEVELPPVRLPPGVALVVDLMIRDGRTDDVSTAIDAPEIRIEARSGPTTTLLWTSRREAGVTASGWRAVTADLGGLGGQEVSLRIAVLGSAGPLRADRPLAFDALVIRTPCARERTPGGAPGDCGEPAAVRVQGTGDTVYRRVPSDVSRGCAPCEGDADCRMGANCSSAWCALGRCEGTEEAAACDGDGRPLSGIASPLAWERVGDAWRYEAEADTWRFPLGEHGGIPRGEAWSPVFFAPPPGTALALLLALETEWDDAPVGAPSRPVDTLRIELVPSPVPGGAPVTPAPIVLWRSDAIGGTTRGATLPLTLPLPAAEGTRVRLRFVFDAGDDAFNDYLGASISGAALVRVAVEEGAEAGPVDAPAPR